MKRCPDRKLGHGHVWHVQELYCFQCGVKMSKRAAKQELRRVIRQSRRVTGTWMDAIVRVTREMKVRRCGV